MISLSQQIGIRDEPGTAKLACTVKFSNLGSTSVKGPAVRPPVHSPGALAHGSACLAVHPPAGPIARVRLGGPLAANPSACRSTRTPVHSPAGPLARSRLGGPLAPGALACRPTRPAKAAQLRLTREQGLARRGRGSLAINDKKLSSDSRSSFRRPRSGLSAS